MRCGVVQGCLAGPLRRAMQQPTCGGRATCVRSAARDVACRIRGSVPVALTPKPAPEILTPPNKALGSQEPARPGTKPGATAASYPRLPHATMPAQQSRHTLIPAPARPGPPTHHTTGFADALKPTAAPACLQSLPRPACNPLMMSPPVEMSRAPDVPMATDSSCSPSSAACRVASCSKNPPGIGTTAVPLPPLPLARASRLSSSWRCMARSGPPPDCGTPNKRAGAARGGCGWVWGVCGWVGGGDEGARGVSEPTGQGHWLPPVWCNMRHVCWPSSLCIGIGHAHCPST